MSIKLLSVLIVSFSAIGCNAPAKDEPFAEGSAPAKDEPFAEGSAPAKDEPFPWLEKLDKYIARLHNPSRANIARKKFKEARLLYRNKRYKEALNLAESSYQNMAFLRGGVNVVRIQNRIIKKLILKIISEGKLKVDEKPEL